MSEDRQIQSMIDFIEREAQEKAEELDQAAQEEYDVEKMRLVEAEKNKIRSQADKNKKQVEIQGRVARANHSKEQRLRVMEERGVILQNLRDLTKKKIMSMVNDGNKYRQLLSDLIKQSMLSIRCDAVVDCRKQDEQIVKKIFSDAESWYHGKTNEKISLSVSRDYLQDDEAWGGVVLHSTDGRITCNNTLAYRTEHCFADQLPTVRFTLLNEDSHF